MRPPFFDSRLRLRLAAALADAVGGAVITALNASDTVEVIVNPDQSLWVEHRRQGRIFCGVMQTASTEAVIRLVGACHGLLVHPGNPMVAAMLPPMNALVSGRMRFQGVLPPLVEGPSFVIRKLGSVVWSLEDYVESRVATAPQVEAMREAMKLGKNVIVAGGTGSGKTTLLNACLAESCFRDSRVVLLEDTPELNFTGEDVVRLTAGPHGSLRDLVKITLRLRPDRIVVGEVRGGEALEMLKAWNTGHPGGLGTVHADGPIQALQRITDLAAEAAPVSKTSVVDAVGLVVFICRDKRHPAGRVIKALGKPRLNRRRDFEIEPVAAS